jgi:predicted N-formylglutamate amidohydrolase
MIQIRSDRIADDEAQTAWASRLAARLKEAAQEGLKAEARNRSNKKQPDEADIEAEKGAGE